MEFGSSYERRSRYNRQLQQWSPVKETAGAPNIPPQVGYCFHSPKKHPWRPIMGYEEIEVTPMPSQPITNTMVDPCYTPTGMAAEPLRFPNLVTGFDRSPEHAARAALYTRYTQYEWNQNSIKNYNESDAKRNFSERVRNDIMRMLRETDEIGTQGQRDSGRRIGERITDTTFWRNEVSIEMERLVSTCEKLNDTRRQLERAIAGIEGPLHIVQECLYHREKRQGLEQVHDAVEQSLLKEVAILRECQDKFRNMLEKVRQQSKNCRATQHELESDMRNKEYSLGIDNMCHQLNNFSKGLQFYAGIERYDPSVCDTERWAAASAATLQRSQSERAKAVQMLSDAENLVNVSATEIWDQWSNTNSAFTRRIAETIEIKNKLQLHLHKVQQEMFDVEKTLELLNKAIEDKLQPLRVAHTRLQARTNRPHLEKCRDEAQNRLVKECCDLQETMETLRSKIATAEGTHQTLLGVRAGLEADLRNKSTTLFIDRDQCMGLRRGYPVTAAIKA
ncbi:tektin-3-like isoform X1 [Pieris napi]|uniref:tektin-3-like isoform X1 n=1 Tax=Pieris napi TaxID=78633 RepID=UPI001FBA5DC7|nr:tektin-3-like isoform X1 [Pieris napi]